ncbi:uncharacterized protein N7515_009332 [Penicillium bovifimosum]|uniref:Uncharacterized protein n=1 Tax=Penicillium bovifimosum TaxID=126998 RepID=A0A9W9KUE6_9EURO|nr:uncharacterized protein N7515_009332 [Penicillium bovifimosum]KAJ5121371.1 hypothetical protein N7515_009332 [Penicillium bovifimosum]
MKHPFRKGTKPQTVDQYWHNLHINDDGTKVEVVQWIQGIQRIQSLEPCALPNVEGSGLLIPCFITSGLLRFKTLDLI